MYYLKTDKQTRTFVLDFSTLYRINTGCKIIKNQQTRLFRGSCHSATENSMYTSLLQGNNHHEIMIARAGCQDILSEQCEVKNSCDLIFPSVAYMQSSAPSLHSFSLHSVNKYHCLGYGFCSPLESLGQISGSCSSCFG